MIRLSSSPQVMAYSTLSAKRPPTPPQVFRWRSRKDNARWGSMYLSHSSPQHTLIFCHIFPTHFLATSLHLALLSTLNDLFSSVPSHEPTCQTPVQSLPPFGAFPWPPLSVLVTPLYFVCSSHTSFCFLLQRSTLWIISSSVSKFVHRQTWATPLWILHFTFKVQPELDDWILRHLQVECLMA